MPAYYRTNSEYAGETVVHDTGGYYEKVKDGWVRPIVIAGNHCGFARSDIPEVCASKSPEASLFAAGHNTPEAGEFHVYVTNHAPTVDISDCGHDFGVLEEVRYQHPSEDPVEFSHYATVTLSERILDDIDRAYEPEGPTIWAEWADGVKDGLAMLLRDGEYPSEIAYADPYADYF